MSNPIYTNLPAENRESDALAELALNLRWSWNHSADELWGRLDPDLWELTQNPWLILQTVSQEKYHAAWSDPAFRRRAEEILREQREAAKETRWFDTAHSGSELKLAAYFSMEYMLSESLPIYSGGLGNVAGDQLKAAHDLGVPVVAIGLLYQQGYFRQEIDSNGNQLALYPFNDPGQLPITPVREKNGEWVRLSVVLPGLKMWIRVWQVRVGRCMLYLLDSNDPGNPPSYRGITSELYGGGPDLRIRQEAVLGIAGWRLLRKLGLDPEVCHLNEGHAAFAVLERARSFMLDHQVPFDQALTVTRAGNVFTTHTAVDAGFDRFAPDLVRKYFNFYANERLHIPFEDLLAMGQSGHGGPDEPFNMAYLAMRGCAFVNGVSRLHGKVSRRLFQGMFSRWPEDDVPVGYVTNGVHTPTWECFDARCLWADASTEHRWRGETEGLENEIRKIPDEQLWRLRTGTTRELIDFTRKRLTRQRASQGASREEINAAGRIFDPNALTLGFARRFATYKRPALLLEDPERLVRILTNRERPVQLILAGKAHPQDGAGQELIRRWSQFLHRQDVAGHVVFLSDYDMLLTQQLVQGVDVWVNTPRRPWEASGTSGMKVLVNGGLNLSELDGWWAEAFSSDVGWAIGDGFEHGDDPAWDRAEANALYDLLEQQVVPEFYTRDGDGIPHAWVARMRESMARLAPYYSANRTVRQYTDSHYVPAATAYRERAKDGGKAGAALLEWRRAMEAHWHELRFGAVQVHDSPQGHEFSVPVSFGGVDPESVLVEIYADAHDGGHAVRQPMSRGDRLADGGYVYKASVPADRPADAFTPRARPQHPGMFLPLESSQILWQR
ncbi:MAG TPA: alpha-glucan family phosphorylase [Bryobacteraceae bacterium]|nr:alpha-glucan family phosphorylase [Bryobacteraceae bacterium]